MRGSAQTRSPRDTTADFNFATLGPSGNFSSLAHSNALFSFSRGGAEATYSPFHNWTVSSVGAWSQSGAWHWFFSWGFVAVSGTLWFARLQKGRTIHELVLKKQPGCLIPRISASGQTRTKANDDEGALLLPMSPWEAARRGGSPALLPESCSEARASGSRTSLPRLAKASHSALSGGICLTTPPISRHIPGGVTDCW